MKFIPRRGVNEKCVVESINLWGLEITHKRKYVVSVFENFPGDEASSLFVFPYRRSCIPFISEILILSMLCES